MDLSIVVALVTSVIASAFALHTYVVGRRDKETSERIEKKIEETVTRVDRSQAECARELRTLTDRLTIEEKATIRQDGTIQLVQQAHSDIRQDIEEVKRMLSQILSELRRSGSSSHSSGSSYSQVLPTPRKDPTR